MSIMYFLFNLWTLSCQNLYLYSIIDVLDLSYFQKFEGMHNLIYT